MSRIPLVPVLRSARLRRSCRAAMLAAAAALLLPRCASGADLAATPSTLADVYARANGGDVIHLASGDYGTFKGGSKSATVSLVPQSRASASMSVDFSPADHLELDGITIQGATLRGAHDVAFVNDRFTAAATVLATVASANILFAGDTFADINVCSSCYEGRITVNSADQPPGPTGVVIANSHFSGGNADGVQLIGQAQGVQIGPGNEFRNLYEVSAVHTDPVQLYGARDTVITGNYFHDTATGIMAANDADSGSLRIEDNVFTRIQQPGAYIGFKPGVVLDHNTFVVPLIINDDPSNGNSTYTQSAVIKNNAMVGGLALKNLRSGAIAEENYNLLIGGIGTHDIRAKPSFVGGSTPSSYADFRLAPGSPGTHAADDGTDMGIRASGGGAGAGAGPSSAPAVTTGTPPGVTLRLPTPGTRFRSRLRLAALAHDDSGIVRVEFWIDRRRAWKGSKAPYAARWRVRRTPYGAHTVTARAYAADGLVSSQAVTVRRVRRRATTARRRVSGWLVTTAPQGADTVLRGRGVPRHRVTVTLTRCADRSARTVVRLRLRASRRGVLQAVPRAAGLCVVGLRPA